MKFGVGQAHPRLEDQVLLSGGGRFTGAMAETGVYEGTETNSELIVPSKEE